MFNSEFGPFDGGSWESLCQKVFKRKFMAEGYQNMPASPGDYGIEGYTSVTGKAFQCYCPDRHYERNELYSKQRDKITEDINKLRAYEKELSKRLGETKINRWIFVTPEFNKNELIAHAKSKEKLVKGWGLSIIADDFTILIHDAENYVVEINEILGYEGQAVIIDDGVAVLPLLDGSAEEYEENILRKTKMRLAEKVDTSAYDNKVKRLHELTLENFLSADAYFRKIESSAPVVYARLIRLINEFEKYVVESSLIWEGSSEELTVRVRDDLERRISMEIGPHLDQTSASRISRCMVARWLAICELDYE